MEVDQAVSGEHDNGLASVPFDLPVEEFVWWALKRAPEFAKGDTGRWESPFWAFLRLLKGHPALSTVDGWEALDIVERAVFACGGCRKAAECGDEVEHGHHWCEMKPYFREMYYSDEVNFDDDEEIRVAIAAEWEAIRWPHGWTPLDVAVDRARRSPVVLGKATTPGFVAFMSVAVWLQLLVGENESILLPVEELAKRLGCSAMTVSRYRALAESSGHLSVVKAHVYRPGGRGEATAFRVDLSAWRSVLHRQRR